MGYDTKLAEETLRRAHGRRDASTHYEARAASVKKLEEALAEAAKTAGYDTERKKCLGVICHAGRGEVRIDRLTTFEVSTGWIGPRAGLGPMWAWFC